VGKEAAAEEEVTALGDEVIDVKCVCVLLVLVPVPDS